MSVREAVALSAPYVPRTKSVSILLARTAELSNRYVIPFSRPVEIVGLMVTTIAASAVGGLVAPTTEALLCDLTVNEGKRYTGMVKASDVAASSNFSDLLALTYQAPRALSIPIAGSGEIGFELRWKRFVAGAPIYEDALVTISADYRFVSEPELTRLLQAVGSE